MRLSPKYVFFGILALGLPFAVTVGWTLGTPVPAPTAVGAPAGEGALGRAPARPTATAATGVDYPSRTLRTSATAIPPSTAPVVLGPSSAPAATVTVPQPSLPPLTDPPVPTPTTVTSAPPSPSPTPSGSVSPDPGGLDPAKLVHRP